LRRSQGEEEPRLVGLRGKAFTLGERAYRHHIAFAMWCVSAPFGCAITIIAQGQLRCQAYPHHSIDI